MNENTNIWEFFKQRKLNYYTKAYRLNQRIFVKDPSCIICNPINQEISEEFNRFWNWYQTIVIVESYTSKTLESFEELLKEEDLVELSKESRKQLGILIGSIRYSEIPEKDITEVRREVVERFIFSQRFTLDSEETENIRKEFLKDSQENTPEESPEEDNPISQESEENNSEEHSEVIEELSEQELESLSRTPISPTVVTVYYQ